MLNIKLGLQVLSIILTFLGAILLVREIHDWANLPSIYYDEGIYSLITLFKYQEHTYILMSLSTCLILIGIGLWINQDIDWVFYQMLLLIISLGIIIPLFYILYTSSTVVNLIAVVTFTFLFIISQIKLYQSLKGLGKDERQLKWSLLIGIICCIIYLSLFNWIKITRRTTKKNNNGWFLEVAN